MVLLGLASLHEKNLLRAPTIIRMLDISLLRSAGFLQELRVRSGLGESLSFHRSNGGNIYANKAAIVR